MIDVLKHIHENIHKPLAMSEVAKQFGYSKWHFCSRFREYTGRTFVEYVRHYRIQLAAMDILRGEKITDVALDYGYETVSGFNKSFLSVFGCVPSEYKHYARECQLYYEKRKMGMFQVPSRCVMLKEEAVMRKQYQHLYSVQRNVYRTLGAAYGCDRGYSNTEVMAEGLAWTIEKMTPHIAPHELLVGFNYADDETLICGTELWPEDNAQGRSMMAENGISPEDAEAFLQIRREKKALLQLCEDYLLTRQELDAQREMAAIGRMIDANHTVLDYEKVLQLGFAGLLEQVSQWEERNGSNENYAAMKRICEAACSLGHRYASEARRLLEIQDGAYDPCDLQRIAEVCDRVPAKPARNFLEAVQALWFAHIVNTWEDGINANSLGRLDQILYPYYQQDIRQGILTREEAFEIICLLWLKLYRSYDVQQSCVGGTDAQGNSQVNELSYLMLDAVEMLDIVRCISVRYGQSTEREFLRRALEVVGHVQKGVPFFFNDDVMIPALIRKGIAPEDACGYAQIGCVETVIPGKSNPHAVTGQVNLLKAIEYVLCNGSSMMYPQMRNGICTGSLSELKSFEQFYQAVLVQIRQLLDISCRVVSNTRGTSVINSPRPYKSLLTQGCMESGRDFNDNGAQYDYYQIMLCGIPNLADSLAAIRKFVYREQRFTLAQLKEMLENDFPDEAVREEWIRKAPKFGNDIGEVDELAVSIMDFACDVLEEYSETYGISFHAQPFTFLWMIDLGRECAASPDGRHRGDPIAYSCSPMLGRDFNGLTALLNSLSKFPTQKTPGTTSALVEVDPKLFCDHNIDTLTGLLVDAGKRGLCNVQFNVVDAEQLLEAQRHPEGYDHLVVRVSGFSQRFNQLTPELQNHIIRRTKHTCL